jgi:hypothetical protein
MFLDITEIIPYLFIVATCNLHPPVCSDHGFTRLDCDPRASHQSGALWRRLPPGAPSTVGQLAQFVSEISPWTELTPPPSPYIDAPYSPYTQAEARIYRLK